MKRKYNELRAIHKEMVDRIVEIKGSITIMTNDMAKLNEEMVNLEIAEDALGKTIDIINSKALNLGTGAMSPPKSGRASPVRDLTMGILKVLARESLDSLFSYKDIMSMLTRDNCFHTTGAVTGILTLMTREGVVVREKMKTDMVTHNGRPMWHYKINDTKTNAKHLQSKYGIELSHNGVVELEAIMNEDVVEKI